MPSHPRFNLLGSLGSIRLGHGPATAATSAAAASPVTLTHHDLAYMRPSIESRDKGKITDSDPIAFPFTRNHAAGMPADTIQPNGMVIKPLFAGTEAME